MPDLTEFSASAIAHAVRVGELSAHDVAVQALAHIDRTESKIHAMLAVNHDTVLKQARDVDAQRDKGRLAGVPIAVKDNILVNGLPLTCGSKILGSFVAPYDATCIARLKAQGAVIIGKANLDEFAMGSSCEHSAFGLTRNPWDTARVPGGSSGGSAAAVAARYAPLSLGSDTGGSIRQPASFTGTVGVKPTYGRVSRYGLVAFGSSLDQIGPFARSVEDAALALEVMAGADANDATTLAQAAPPLVGQLEKREPRGLRVGWVPEHFSEGCDAPVRDAVQAVLKGLEGEGAKLVELAMPVTDYSVQAYYIIATAEASSNLNRFDGVRYGARQGADSLLDLYLSSRGSGFGPEVKRRIMLGTFVLSSGYQDAYYKRALKVREMIRREYVHCFERCDVIIGPTAPSTAFKFGEHTANPLKMYLCDIYTIGANLADVPAMSMPCGVDAASLPIGVHLQSRAGDDLTMLQTASMIERMVPFTHKPQLV